MPSSRASRACVSKHQYSMLSSIHVKNGTSSIGRPLVKTQLKYVSAFTLNIELTWISTMSGKGGHGDTSGDDIFTCLVFFTRKSFLSRVTFQL